MRKFFYGSIFIILILTLTTCKQFIADIEKDFENWVSTVLIKEIIPDSPKDGQSYLCIPSASDQTVTLKLLNSRRHSLKMPEGPGTYTDIITFESGVKGIDGGVPVHGTDYELEQIGFDEIRLKYKKAFLKKYEYGNQDLSPRITFISKEGRKFETRTFKLRCNTPPPDITNAVICKTSVPFGSPDPAYYVLCISCNSDKLKEKMGSDFLHKDIKNIIINGTEYPIELNSSGTGFTTTDSNFIAKTDVLSLNSSPTPDANLYFKTNAVVGGIKTDYTLYIGDEKKLSSSNKKTVSTPANTPDNAKLYDMTVTSPHEILSNDPASPYTIAYKDISEDKIKLKAETATRGAIIKGEVKKHDGSTYIYFAIDSGPRNSVDIELDKPVSGDVFYKIEFRAEGDGFTPSDLQIRYVKLIEGGTITIKSTDGWKKLKAAVEASNGPNLIIIDGEIKAENPSNNYGEIKVSRTLTIKGKADFVSDILNANKDTGGKLHHRIFKIEPSGNLTLEGLTLTGGGSITDKTNGAAVYSKGSFTAKNCKFEDNEAGSNSVAGAGGAVYVESGQTTIDNCKFISNNANIGGAVYVGVNGKCKIGTETDQTTKIYSNTAVNGAGIYAASTQIDGCLINKGTIIGTDDDMNLAGDLGGGIFISIGANCTIKKGVKIQNNEAQNGGGIYNDGGNLTIQGTVSDKVIISGCKADSTTNPSKKKGGGIYIAGGTVKIEHTSINGNTVGSSGEGQGIYVADGTFEMKAGAKIDENNDVYLKEQKTIKVKTSDLGDFGAKITPKTYPNINKVITVLEGPVTEACNDKFKVSDKSSTHWKVDKRGNLAQLVNSSDSWKTLKGAVANAPQDAVIYIYGEIKASGSGDNFGAIEIKKPFGFPAGEDRKLTIMGLTGSGSDILNANYGTGGNMNYHQIFKVYTGTDFSLKGLTLKGADSGSQGGGAIYTEGKVEMANCVITENKASYAVRGGGVLIAGGTFTMIGGEIKNNSTKVSGEGGGVCINGGTFKMIGGRIKENNQGVNSKGKGVYVAGGSFTMSGSAKIDENNDVYLPTNKTINIFGELTAEGTAAVIEPQIYPTGSNNIKVLADDISDFANYKKFKVKSNVGTPWYVNSYGNLTTTEP